jgi:HEAT repeat protein
VIIIALKLSASYHQFQLYDKIVECLKHSNPKVRLQAIKCLKDIYEDTTAWNLMSIYSSEPKSHQLAILSALKEIASADSVPFLEKQLDSEDNQIKVFATRALFHCGEEGRDVVEKHPKRTHYPLYDIIQQVKMENIK